MIEKVNKSAVRWGKCGYEIKYINNPLLYLILRSCDSLIETLLEKALTLKRIVLNKAK